MIETPGLANAGAGGAASRHDGPSAVGVGRDFGQEIGRVALCPHRSQVATQTAFGADSDTRFSDFALEPRLSHRGTLSQCEVGVVRPEKHSSRTWKRQTKFHKGFDGDCSSSHGRALKFEDTQIIFGIRIGVYNARLRSHHMIRSTERDLPVPNFLVLRIDCIENESVELLVLVRSSHIDVEPLVGHVFGWASCTYWVGGSEGVLVICKLGRGDPPHRCIAFGGSLITPQVRLVDIANDGDTI